MTEDERRDEAAFLAKMIRIEKARQAICLHLGPWRRKFLEPNRADVIDCPVCGCAKALRFRRSGSNGHIKAACTTPGCVQWME